MMRKIPLIGYVCNWIKCQRRKGSMKDVFTAYYKENYWSSDESVSGGGSELRNVKKVIEELPKILKSVNAKSILDVPCGDYNWMKNAVFDDVKYMGGDIVEEVIARNKEITKGENVEFQVMDLCEGNLPVADVIFVRDCLVHLSNEDAKKALNNITNSGSRYLLTTTFNKKKKNKDIKTGFWRSVNLQLEPFNFPEPELIVNEEFSGRFGKNSDKSLGLWEIDKLPKF